MGQPPSAGCREGARSRGEMAGVGCQRLPPCWRQVPAGGPGGVVPPWAGAVAGRGRQSGRLGDDCLAPRPGDAHEQGPLAVLPQFPCPGTHWERCSECSRSWPPSPAARGGLARNQRYLTEKMKGYAESFPSPAPSSGQELPALTTRAGPAALAGLCRVPRQHRDVVGRAGRCRVPVALGSRRRAERSPRGWAKPLPQRVQHGNRGAGWLWQ